MSFISVSPGVFANTASKELLHVAPQNDSAIQKLAYLILHDTFTPQNTEIHFSQDATHIMVRFSKLGKLTYLKRTDQGCLFNRTFQAAFPSFEIPGPVAKYHWVHLDTPKAEKCFRINPQINRTIWLSLGTLGLIVAFSVNPIAGPLSQAIRVAGAVAISAVALPIIFTSGAIMLCFTAAVLPAIAIGGAIITAAIAPVVAVAALVSSVVLFPLLPFLIFCSR